MATPHVYLDFTTCWGSDKIHVTEEMYEQATAKLDSGRLNPDFAGKRDSICIRAKKKLIAKGATIYRLEWHELDITAVRHEDVPEDPEEPSATPQLPSPLASFKAQVAEIVDSIPLIQVEDAERPTDEEINEAAELFPNTFRVPSRKALQNAKQACICVPYPVTMS